MRRARIIRNGVRTLLTILTTAALCCGCAARDAAPSEEELTRTPLGDAAPCAVHGTPQRLDRVPSVYGRLLIPPREYAEAEKRLFPNANTYVWGGCCTYPGIPQIQTVYYCPDCRRAREAWQRQTAHEQTGTSRAGTDVAPPRAASAAAPPSPEPNADRMPSPAPGSSA